ARVSAVAQFLYQLGWNFNGCVWCAHSFFSLFPTSASKIGGYTSFDRRRRISGKYCGAVTTPLLEKRPLQVTSERAAFLASVPAKLCLRVVGRYGGFRGDGRGFFGAFDEIAFLLFVLFVGAGVHVFDAVGQSLVRGGFLFADLGLLVVVLAF